MYERNMTGISNLYVLLMSQATVNISSFLFPYCKLEMRETTDFTDASKITADIRMQKYTLHGASSNNRKTSRLSI